MRRALFALALSVLGCHKADAITGSDAGSTGPRVVRLDPGSMQRLGVKVEPAGVAAPSRVLHVPGTLDYNYDKYAEVGVPLDGRVIRVDVRVGDKVKKGQVLAQIIVPSVASAQADFLTAKATAQAARKNREREEELLSKQLTTAREAEVAKSEALKAEADLAAAEARLRAMRVDLPTSDTAIAGAGSLALTAPIDGLVVSRKANLGAYLTPNESAFIVADLSELWAALDIPESDLTYLQVGAEVDLLFDAIPGRKFKGTLALIEPALGKATRTARARVTVPNSDGSLRAGLFVRAQIQLPSDRPGALLVAAPAVQPLGEQDVVFVERENGMFEVRPVQVLRRTTDVVEIGEGLSSGERIAVEGAFLLRGEVSKQ
jgi:cobalt-zinc-cadmium efflux system membrane fusion protein